MTVTVVVTVPELVVYEIVTEPAETAVTTPVVLPIVAMAVLLLLHVPPEVASLNVVVPAAHKVVVPVIGEMEPLVTVIDCITDAPPQAL